MSDQAWYKDWFNSPYYHLLYQHRDVDEASQFITKLIEHLQPKPNAKMLDVACGKGRHSKALADMGFDVSGIDLAAESIEEAKELENENLHFFQHDMRLPFWINYYDYAFNFFTSFGYFRTQREHDNAIRTIAQSICRNGIFVIDYLNVHYSEDHLVASEQKKIDNVNFIISRSHDETHFYKKIEIEENGKLLENSYSEKVAKFSLGDFTDMMSYQGLQVDNVYGDYQLGHYDVRKSPRMIVIAKKVR
jgi:2-polyprenyl-3-methyl-5-hydroxy-6-metoxy-1,4-benzoquinol methylase